jgi:N-acetylglucosamine-6-phosphate deacetylase
MRSLHHRDPGPLAAIFENKNISVQIISDGHHLHPSIVNLIYQLIGGDRCICITDGMHGIGLPDGFYFYNGKKYESKDGAARYLNGTLIGSTTSLANIALKFMRFTRCSLETAINTVSKNPARLLNIYDRKGSLDIGKDADIILFDKDNSIFATIVRGRIVYKKL